jgi:hypothetical protein
VELTGTGLRALPEGTHLIPGMTVTAEIKVGARSVISYFLTRYCAGSAKAFASPDVEQLSLPASIPDLIYIDFFVTSLSKNSKVPRPLALARYSAVSALPSSCSQLSISLTASATPMLVPMEMSWPEMTNGLAIERMRRRARMVASLAPVMLCRTTNSSPPMRAMVSMARVSY